MPLAAIVPPHSGLYTRATRPAKCVGCPIRTVFGRMTTLRHYRLCPHSRSIRMLMSELRRSVTLVEDKPWTWPEDLLAVNPAGDLPVLVQDDGGALCGAYAISEWASDELVGEVPGSTVETPSGVSVVPGTAQQRAEVRRLIDWFHGKMHREVTGFLLEEKVYTRFRESGGDSPDPETLRTVQANMRVHMRYLEHLTDARKWLAGDTLSFADLAAAGQLSVADYLGGIDWAGHEAAHLWYARMKSRPSVREILAERVPGAPLPPEHYDDPDF